MLAINPEMADFEALSSLFALLSNPIRLQILDYLLSECCLRTAGCCSVTDIYTELQLPQPLISKHLRILKEQGILDFTRHGNKILYTFATDSRLMLLNSYISRFAAVGQNCCAENKGN